MIPPPPAADRMVRRAVALWGRSLSRSDARQCAWVGLLGAVQGHPEGSQAWALAAWRGMRRELSRATRGERELPSADGVDEIADERLLADERICAAEMYGTLSVRKHSVAQWHRQNVKARC